MAVDPHKLALEAMHNLQELNTYLAKSGADDGIVKTVAQMATVTKKVAAVLGNPKPNPGEEPAAEEAPAEQSPQAEGPRPTIQSATGEMTDEMAARKRAAMSAARR